MKISDVYPDRIMPWQREVGFPWPGLRFALFDDPLRLDEGSALDPWVLAFEEWGIRGRGPTVMVLHALTGDSHVAASTPDDHAAWWSGVVGPGKAIDPDHYHVVSANVLGGAMGSLGPASTHADGRPWGSRFPRLSLNDMVRALHRLVEELDLGPVVLIGGSMGGMMALAYALEFGMNVRGVMAIGSPICHGPWAIAYHTVSRTAIRQDPGFLGGDYYDKRGPEQGLALARMADMISYQSPEAMARKFGRSYQPDRPQEFRVSSYLRHQGDKLVRRFDANTYLGLSQALDREDLRHRDWSAMTSVPTTLVGISSDMLYLPEEIRGDVDWLQVQGVPARYRLLQSPYGHDSFLVDQAGMGAIVHEFLWDILQRGT